MATHPYACRASLAGEALFEFSRHWLLSFCTANPGGVVMKELIQYIAEALVDHPEEVSVSEVEGNQTSVLELKVAKEDLGKVIGKQGRTARAMRTILSAASAKIKKRTVLEIIE
jgi:predicted RNA-binding protein YlqC (UPF0109 family)